MKKSNPILMPLLAFEAMLAAIWAWLIFGITSGSMRLTGWCPTESE